MKQPTFETTIGQSLWAAHAPTYPDRLLTTDQVAAITRLKKTYLETLRSRGGGPGYLRFNGRVFYDLAKLIHWIEDSMETHK